MALSIDQASVNIGFENVTIETCCGDRFFSICAGQTSNKIAIFSQPAEFNLMDAIMRAIEKGQIAYQPSTSRSFAESPKPFSPHDFELTRIDGELTCIVLCDDIVAQAEDRYTVRLNCNVLSDYARFIRGVYCGT